MQRKQPAKRRNGVAQKEPRHRTTKGTISKKEIGSANKVLFRAWKKTYENRRDRVD